MQRASQKRAKIAWEGDSLDILRKFPDDVRKDLGFALDLPSTREAASKLKTNDEHRIWGL